jgi:hypothetical protein
MVSCDKLSLNRCPKHLSCLGALNRTTSLANACAASNTCSKPFIRHKTPINIPNYCILCPDSSALASDGHPVCANMALVAGVLCSGCSRELQALHLQLAIPCRIGPPSFSRTQCTCSQATQIVPNTDGCECRCPSICINKTKATQQKPTTRSQSAV